MAKSIRNIAIIAHVDHGKTTVVDALLRSAGLYRDNQKPVDQVMDSDQLERERGITIMAKNTSIVDGDMVINIVDTPGHHDFGGEVERVLNMVDGILLVVDAAEGPMPQTTFVLKKALEHRLPAIVLINKIDRADARPLVVEDLVLDLFIKLGADDRQIEYPVLYGVAKRQAIFNDLPLLPVTDQTLQGGSVRPLLDAIRDAVPSPPVEDGPLQMLISNLEYDAYVGRLAIGRIKRGTLRKNQAVAVGHSDTSFHTGKITALYRFAGLERKPEDSVGAGDIAAVAGLPDAKIGDTISDLDEPSALPFTSIDEPTLEMTFRVNDSIYASDESTYLTSRHLRERLQREVLTNVSMVVEDTVDKDAFVVKGRGELHLSILIENMRREGYAFMVSKPRVVTKEEDGMLLEPVELVTIDLPAEHVGSVIEKLGQRRGELANMFPPDRGLVRLEFSVPSRGLIGYRFQFLSDTKGTGTLNTTHAGFVPHKGAIETRGHGVLVATETGEATRYGLYQAEDRGELFVTPGTPVYEGMIVGQTSAKLDVAINVCRKKHVTNIRAAGADEALRLSPPVTLSLEQAMEFISDDELIEITPVSFRLRKRILNTGDRQRDEARRRVQGQ